MDASVIKNRRGGKRAVKFSGKHRVTGVKRHVIIDGNGHPLGVRTTRANRHEVTEACAVIDQCTVNGERRRPRRCGLDKGYDSDPIRLALRHRKIVPCIPHRENRTKPSILTARERREQRYCRQRWKVERSFAWINNSRRINQMHERTLFQPKSCVKITPRSRGRCVQREVHVVLGPVDQMSGSSVRIRS